MKVVQKYFKSYNPLENREETGEKTSFRFHLFQISVSSIPNFSFIHSKFQFHLFKISISFSSNFSILFAGYCTHISHNNNNFLALQKTYKILDH